MLRYLILILLLFKALLAKAEGPFKVGDILLQPLQCWSCSLIEAQERSIFSHMGVVVALKPEVMIAEAYGEVRVVPLKLFASKTEPGQRMIQRRLKNPHLVAKLQSPAFLETFQRNFRGLDYDSEFLWDNIDHQGREKLYCSEMVAKLFQTFDSFIGVPLKRMRYDVNREHWETFFNGKVPPDGKWGNAPADFERSVHFYTVGEL